jgi:AcrR family transcriptional regulator
MSRTVNPRRRYDSSRRRAQARETRRAILEAARALFLDRGYASTTVPAIAAAAGVAAPTVYKAFRNKAGLLKAVFDVAIVGDYEPIPMLERDMVRRIRAQPDAPRMLLMYGEHLAAAGLRAAAIQLVARDAGATDPEAAHVWEQMVAERLVGMGHFARELYEGGHLRPDVSIDEARDVLWTYNSVEIYHLLVLQRGWSPQRYGRWVAEALIAALLPRH